ncbi:MAG: type II secretion system protein [Bacillota bacterium]
MHNWFARLKKNEAGLTLIELIVVVAIIGVLAWLITPRVLDALKKSKINSAESAANEFLSAMERYGSENARYPADPTTNGNTAGELQMQELYATLNISASKAGSYFKTGTFEYEANTAGDNFCAVFEAVQANGTDTHVWIGKQGVFWGGAPATANSVDELPACTGATATIIVD